MELPKQLLYLGSQLGFMEARQTLLKETKFKKLSDLREKFEADKERQRKMIADRKFKPA